ncbi:extracellular sulfatase Sulf-2a [Etheostoma spectabile]|uniref:extracellular sulfatase Sulf-2a n=1 Tax=Etheostoma spectabile TaxID=54343 RepID=UPI0013AF7C32|nr:extracellular sulfatase Sulf-2-like [Etheostoma spectabile]
MAGRGLSAPLLLLFVLLVLVEVLPVAQGSGYLSGHRLRTRLQRDRHFRNIRPNIILILTDDQDIELGSMQAMNKTRHIMEKGGTHFSNAFSTTPMCCPSRSSILTGKYVHNHHTYTNNENCSSPSWQAHHEPHTFAVYLNNSGYRTAFFGKYLNEYNGSYVPPGWKEWVALVKNSRFYNYTLCRNGVREKHSGDYSKDSPDRHLTRQFKILPVSKGESPSPLYDGPNLCSEARRLRPQYRCLPQRPRNITPSYNYAPNLDKHWILRYTGAMKPVHMQFTNMLQRRRMQTLLSVDDSMEKLYNMLAETGELDNTYIIYTSDHGYHIGQFGLVKGKSMPYEFDIRVPFYVRGPNVEQGAINPHIVLNVDLAPTLLDMAGVDIPAEMDGKSILKLLDTDRPVNRFQLNRKSKTWRDSFLVERGKPPHKRGDGKEMAQEENFLPKYQRVKDLCQKAEYQTSCQQPGQKWQCVEDPTGKLRLYKCKGMASLFAPRMQALMASGASHVQLSPTSNSDSCNCDDVGFKTSVLKRKRLLTKKSPPVSSHSEVKSSKSVSRKRWARSVSFELDGDLYAVDLEEGYRPLGSRNSSWATDRKRVVGNDEDNEEFSGMEVTAKPTTSNKLTPPDALKVTYRCSILMNDTVKCDGGLYKSLQAWKDHKLHIEHEIETLQTKIKNLRDVKGHLKKVRPEECQCNTPSYLLKNKEMFRLNAGRMHSVRMPSKQKSQWLQKEQKRRKKLRKFLKRLQNNDTCSMPGLTCFTHDNHHWQTAPFWTMGPFCACTSANNNTYWCLRTINDTHNFLFCEFATGFLEYFDLNNDPYQLINAVSTLDRNALNAMHQQLMDLRGCKGHKQCNPEKGGKERNYFSEYRPVHRRKRPKVKKPSSKSLGQIWEGWVG